MTITEKINHFIEHEGNGDVRDALNIALFQLEQKNLIIELREAEVRQLREKIEQIEADLDMVGAGF